MAQTKTSKFVNTFRDIDLNFGIHPVKKDINKRVDAYAITNSLKNLILTNHYERPFQPELGSNIRRLMFENVDVLMGSQIEREIRETIANFEPRVSVSRVTVKVLPDENRYNVEIEFFITNQTLPIIVNFFLDRVR